MKKAVIIGGGFAGSYAAKELENKFNVVLIDTTDYFEYTPGILRIIVKPENLEKIQVRHEEYLKKTKIIVGFVKEINNKFVKINGKKIDYDYLVICSGSDYTSPIKELGVVIANRIKSLEDAYGRLKKAKEVLIVGGGLVGVELAAEICTYYKDKEITLVHSGEHLIQRNDQKSIAYAENFLKRHGVKLLFCERITASKGKNCSTETGKNIRADIVFMATGIKSNSDFMKKAFKGKLNGKGQIKVNKYLQLEGENNIFVAGDVNDMNEEKTAQNAEKQAEIVVKNILALEKGLKLEEYKSKKRALVISLGKYNGIMEYGNFVLKGKIPALLKFFIERQVMQQHS